MEGLGMTADHGERAEARPSGRKLVTIIVPAYNESDCIDELAKQLAIVMDGECGYDFEVLVVENGSQDDTWEKLLGIHRRDQRFKIIQLSRNFRMDGGLTAGLAHARGDAAVIMTADLQDPPDLIPTFIRRWEEGYENVYMVVMERKGTGPLRRFNSWAFYWLANKATEGRIVRNASDFRLVDRRVYTTINSMEERNRFVRGLFSWVGYKSTGVEHVRSPRFGGESKAHTFKVLDLAFKGIFAHSYLPLRLISVTGIAVSILSFLSLAVLALRFVLYGVPFAGFGTLIGFVLLLFGILFSMIGIVSEYVGLIYEEVKQRPNYVVRELVGVRGINE